MYEELIDIAIKIIATCLTLFLTWLGTKYIKGKKLDQYIDTFCEAAEQQYKANDPSGAVRLEYVQKMLVEVGYTITDIILAKVEAKVFEINGGAKNEDISFTV